MKMRKRVLSILCASIFAASMAVPSISAADIPVTPGVSVTLQSQKTCMMPQNMTDFVRAEYQKYPNSKYWAGGNVNHWTSSPSSTYNYYTPDFLCSSGMRYDSSGNQLGVFGYYAISTYSMRRSAGFASKLQADYFQTDSFIQCNLSRSSNRIKFDDNTTYTPRIGDVIKFYDNGGFSIFITNVNGSTISYVDCDADGNCKINWSNTANMSDLNVHGHRYVDYVQRPMMVGDVNGDTFIDAKDQTELFYIQLNEPTVVYNRKYRDAAADITRDGIISILDGPTLQQVIAGTNTRQYGYLYE
ncbi:MAG: hypothetical protein Q4F95_03375 [Oscillospiraceae bacterium]|nr:hypothetical protein [Oscillospiraceae bacterium]